MNHSSHTMPTPPTAPHQPKKAAPWMIVLPVGLLTLLLGLYGVYWLTLSNRVTTGLDAWAEDARANGIETAWSNASVSGFPLRLALTVDHPLLAKPGAESDWEWQTEKIVAQFLPYRLDHVILNIEGENIIRYTDQSKTPPARHEVRAKTQNAWASHIREPGAPSGTHGRFALDIEALEAFRDALGGTQGDRIAARRVQLHTRPSPAQTGGKPGDHDLAFKGTGVELDLMGHTLPLGPALDHIEVQARLRRVPANLEGAALLQRWARGGGALAVSKLRLIWGPLDLEAQGEMHIDAAGRPEGRFDAMLSHHEKLLAALVQAGLIDARQGRLAFAGLEAVSILQGESNGRVRMPIMMRDGQLYLGPLALGALGPIY